MNKPTNKQKSSFIRYAMFCQLVKISFVWKRYLLHLGFFGEIKLVSTMNFYEKRQINKRKLKSPPLI